MARTFHYYWLDVFTQQAFGGNQLVVFPDAQGLTDAQMQQIAREFNISETVFLFPPQTPAGTRRARIFTPGRELPFAGHPTIGAVHVLATIGRGPNTSPPHQVVLEEQVGPVPVTIDEQSGGALFLELSAARAPEFRPLTIDPETFAPPLNLRPTDFDRSFPAGIVSCGNPFVILPLKNADALRRARLNPEAWLRLVATGALGTTEPNWTEHVYPITNDLSVRPADLRVRMFGVANGIIEDPATGSAAASLAAHLAMHATQPDGTLRWTVEQGIELGRRSLLYLAADKTRGDVMAVRVGGYAVTVSEGELTVPA
jgi:trans-2,3-dihydro-3-hydroxyanthranilate isomerase